MSDREKTCAERIGEHLASRVDDLRDLSMGLPSSMNDKGERAPTDDEQEQASEELYEYPLCVTVERVVRVDLSTGGPADWLELFYRVEEAGPHRIVYHFSDWFDHADVALEGDDFSAIVDAFGDLGEILQ